MLSGNQTTLNSLPNDLVLAKYCLLANKKLFFHLPPVYPPQVVFVTITSWMGQINIARIVTRDKGNVSFYQWFRAQTNLTGLWCVLKAKITRIWYLESIIVKNPTLFRPSYYNFRKPGHLFVTNETVLKNSVPMVWDKHRYVKYISL